MVGEQVQLEVNFDSVYYLKSLRKGTKSKNWSKSKLKTFLKVTHNTSCFVGSY